MFWERFYNLCELKNIKPNNLAKEIDVSSGLITKWKQGFTPNTDALCKIADYFSVTTDYLLGRSDSPSEEQKSSFNEHSKSDQEFVGDNFVFFEQFEKLCNENNTTPTRFTLDVLHLSSSKVTAWKNGSIPKYEILTTIANYFNVSVGFLFDGEQKSSSNELSKYEQEFSGIFKNLTTDQQNQLIGMAKLMAMQNEEEFRQGEVG
jgi:transcriptional regulator with XRE-family HTH domain